MVERNSAYTVEFYILGENDVEAQSQALITSSTLHSGDVAIDEGLYSPRLGTTELSYNCKTDMLSKLHCPGHSGHFKLNYPVQQPLFSKDIIKWLKLVCHTCGNPVIKKNLSSDISKSKRLMEASKQIKSSNEKAKICSTCNATQPWVVKDLIASNIIWREYYVNKTKLEKKEIMYNDEISKVLDKIPDSFVELMGKKIESHPRKLITNILNIPSVVIRPVIRGIGGNRSTMSDVTHNLKSILTLNSQIPKEMPQHVDNDLHAKLVLMDLTLSEMIKGSTGTSSNLKLVTNTNKVSFSLASRLAKKTGRLRGNLMGKRVRKMMRSVITGDKALKPNEVGVPKIILQNSWIPVTVNPWNRNQLTSFFQNGSKVYPGCQKIRRLDTGSDHYVDDLNSEYILQDGDIVYRNAIDGDLLGLNREPALIYCSIAVFNIVAIKGLTLKFNSINCIIFNADFDGDEMNGLMIQNIQSMAETQITSSINQWFVSYQTSKPLYGLYQDSIIGASEMTRTTTDGIDKFHAMSMFNRCSITSEFIFDKQTYHGRELISKLLPPINYSGTSRFYVKEFAPYINYKDEDMKVSIVNGNLVTGILDKDSIGQEAEGGIFHIIYSERGATEAIETIYNIQQIINHFLYYNGATFGLGDIYLPKETRDELKLETAKTIAASNEVTKLRDEGKLIVPIGMTASSTYEEKQTIALDHGDEFIKPIINAIDTENNWFYKFIFSGSKGTKSNLLNIFGSLGSIGIRGARVKMALDGRTSINFQRYSTDPASRGYNASNFIDGIDTIIFPFSAMEARYELIEIALSTAVGGTLSRNAVKNLESILVGNTRSSEKSNKLVQVLYGESGIDPRKMKMVKFPTAKISDNDMIHYKTKINNLNSRWNNSFVEESLNNEYNQLLKDRATYRDIFLNWEVNSRGNYIFKDEIRMPINVSRIMTNVINLADNDRKDEDLDPIKAINLVKEYCSSLGYIYLNDIMRKNKSPIPKHIESALTLLRILIRSNLNLATLLDKKISYKMLEIILSKITYGLVSSLISSGTCVGIIAAQSVSQPIVQHLLDSKHRSGLKKTKINMIVRFDEILKNKIPSEMENPQMTLVVKDEYKYDKQKVMEIANHIEMLTVDRFVSRSEIYQEEFENPSYAPDLEFIKKFQIATSGDAVPRDLINWCIKFIFKEEELILKSIDLMTINLALTEKYPHLYIVYTPSVAKISIMRIYIRNIIFKKGEINIHLIMDIEKLIRRTIVRGIDGINNTYVRQMVHSYIKDDGSIDTQKMFVIETDGTNLSGILENKFLNVYECTTTAIKEIEDIYGIEAARNKILDELTSTLKEGSVFEHISIYADEMSFTPHVSSIQRTGLAKRDDSVFLKATFGSPIQVFESAAINGQVDRIKGMSAPMVMGTVPRFGTTYNNVCIDEEEVELLSKSPEQVLDSLGEIEA